MTGALRRRPAQRVDIDGGGGGVVFDRDPITGPVGVLLCGGGGGADVVGFGADVGCGCVGAGSFDRDEVAVAGEEACESLMDPPLGRSSVEAVEAPPGAIAAPLGRSESLGAPAPVEETAALFVSGAGCWLAVLLQAAQTRAAATAVAAALAGATVPRIGMDATVAKWTAMREDSYACTRCAARPLHRIRPGRLFA
ncbi:hypothetical protein [Catenulispora sp. GP43]|uniref:hypothetical protein n=1 Tax=Catenulispora sp. GP43 TaxID=3156263 RepID=UPI003519D650